jgi:hypothetical protein
MELTASSNVIGSSQDGEADGEPVPSSFMQTQKQHSLPMPSPRVKKRAEYEVAVVIKPQKRTRRSLDTVAPMEYVESSCKSDSEVGDDHVELETDGPQSSADVPRLPLTKSGKRTIHISDSDSDDHDISAISVRV